ncbi:hypothetical protein [Streptomyces sp. NPDC000994]
MDLVDALAARTTPHLIVTVVPEQAGEMVIDSVPADAGQARPHRVAAVND